MALILKQLNKITIKNYSKYFAYIILALIIQSCNSESKKTESTTNKEKNINDENDFAFGFATIDFEKTEKERTYNGKLNYYPRINKNSQILICISQEIKSDFSNAEKVRYDTVIVKNGRFPIEFKKNGAKTLRGVVIERYPKNPKDTLLGKQKPITLIETKTYFEQKFYVK